MGSLIKSSLLYQGTKDKEDTSKHPCLDRSQPLRLWSIYVTYRQFYMDLFHLWGVGCDCIEDVDKDEEEGDEEGHPARDDVHGDEERDPGNNHKQTCIG